MKVFRATFTRKMDIAVTLQAPDVDAAENMALELAEAVGFTNLSPSVEVYLQKETSLDSMEEIA